MFNPVQRCFEQETYQLFTVRKSPMLFPVFRFPGFGLDKDAPVPMIHIPLFTVGILQAERKRRRMQEGREGNAYRKRRFWVIGVFTYVLLTGVLVQFLMLPLCLPSMDCGNGLIRGSDAAGFHRVAVKQMTAMHAGGWTVWTLRPEGQSVAGIASVLYAVTGIAEPWLMLPVNAAIWAFSAWLLFLILRPLTGADSRAFLCSLPLVAGPSALPFLTQIHKDPFIIAGTLVLWFALIRIMEGRKAGLRLKDGLRVLAWITAGLFLLWIGRPYLMFFALLGWAITGVTLLLSDLVQRRFSRMAWFVVLLASFISCALMRTRAAQDYATVGSETPQWAAKESNRYEYRSSGLGVVDSLFGRMVTMRAIYLQVYPDARSKLDEDVSMGSAFQVVAYLPRAVQILFWAPFPSAWVGGVGNNLLASVVYVETAIRYLLFPGLVWLGWRQRRCLSFWLPILFFIPWGVIYVITTPNLGTLIRVRYSLVMIMAALGLAGSMMLMDAVRRRRTSG